MRHLTSVFAKHNISNQNNHQLPIRKVIFISLRYTEKRKICRKLKKIYKIVLKCFKCLRIRFPLFVIEKKVAAIS